MVVALGHVGFDAYLNHLRRRGLVKAERDYPFKHGSRYDA